MLPPFAKFHHPCNRPPFALSARHPFWPVFLSCFLSLPAAAHCNAEASQRAAPTLIQKDIQEKRSPKLYLHNASYTQPVFQWFCDVCVSAAYNWHYALRASPNSRTPCAPDPGTKTAKKQSKGMQAPHWPTRCKKARVYKQPIIFVLF